MWLIRLAAVCSVLKLAASTVTHKPFGTPACNLQIFGSLRSGANRYMVMKPWGFKGWRSVNDDGTWGEYVFSLNLLKEKFALHKVINEHKYELEDMVLGHDSWDPNTKCIKTEQIARDSTGENIWPKVYFHGSQDLFKPGVEGTLSKRSVFLKSSEYYNDCYESVRATEGATALEWSYRTDACHYYKGDIKDVDYVLHTNGEGRTADHFRSLIFHPIPKKVNQETTKERILIDPDIDSLEECKTKAASKCYLYGVTVRSDGGCYCSENGKPDTDFKAITDKSYVWHRMLVATEDQRPLQPRLDHLKCKLV